MTKKEIAEELGKEFGVKYENILNSIDEIKLYANHEWLKYQWTDLRYKKYSDAYKNKMFDTRSKFKKFIIEYLDNELAKN